MKKRLPYLLLPLLGLALFSCDRKNSAIEELRAKGIIQNELKINELDAEGRTALHNAVLQGNMDCVELLLDAGADVNAKAANGRTPLDIAVFEERKDIVKAMLKHKVKVQGAFPLTAAIMKDMPEFVQPLLDAGAWTDPCNAKELPPLLAAVMREDRESFKAVLAAIMADEKENVDLGADYNYHDKEDNHLTPLTLAIDFGLDEFVQDLVQAGADPTNMGIDLCYPIELAAKQGKLKYVKLLLPLSKKDKYICARAMEAAALEDKPECLKLLLETGCADTKDPYFGNPPLINIVFKAPLRSIEMILKGKVDVNATNKDGVSPLAVAARHGRADVVALLLKSKADVNQADKHGRTPLVAALTTYTPHFDCADLLLKAGADINVRAEGGKPMLQDALRGTGTEMAEYLLSHGADPNAMDADGEPLLLAALRQEGLKMAELLIAKGADVNVKTKDGSPIINYILLNEDALKLLLRNGADVRAKDKNGITVLEKKRYDSTFREVLESLVK